MQLLLKHGPMSRGDLATATGYSERHIRRTLPAMEGITMQRDGRKILYSVAAAAAEEKKEAAAASSTTTITPSPEPGHSGNVDIQCGHQGGQMSTMATLDDGQHGQRGHFSEQIKKERAAIGKRTPNRHTQSPPGAPTAPGCTDCTGEDAHKCRSCPLSYADLEHDTIQFVVVDQEFRDRLVEEATLKQWRRKNDRGLTWIYRKNLTLQVGGDVVVFYSDEPEDLSSIVTWVRQNFALLYSDIGSLVSKIKHPHELTRDELTVVIRDPPSMEAMRTALSMRMDKTGTFYLKSPNQNVPGFKAYYRDGTLRCEFDCRDDARKISALYMRRRLLQIIPQVADAPGLFDEWLTDYYNPYEHPILIDTGGDIFLKTLTDITDKFTGILREFAAAAATRQAPPQPLQVPVPVAEDPLTAASTEVENLDGFDINGIVLAFQRTLKLEDQATKVYLAAWSVWQQRNFRGRVLKEDIASLLQKANEPLSAADIADAIAQLKGAHLLENDERLEIRFSPGGVALARKLVAKREGM